MTHVLQWDKALLLWINSHHNWFLDAILGPVAYAGEVGAVWFIAVAVLLILNRPGYRRTAVLLFATIILVDILPAKLMGMAFPRERPYIGLENIRHMGVHWQSPSFPSGHAHSVWVSTIIISSRFRKLLWPLIVFAILTCYSRPYFGMHYPLDAVAGALLGIAGGTAAVFVDRWLQNRGKAAPDAA